MSWRLWVHDGEYLFLEPHEVHPGHEPMVFRNALEAEGLIRRLRTVPGNMAVFRAIVERILWRTHVYRLADGDVARMLAEALSGTLLVVVEQPLAEAYVLPDAPEQRQAKPRETPTRRKTWIEFVLVDELGRPVPGVRYRVTTAGGAVVGRGTLNETGHARVEGIDPGVYQVSFPDLDRALVTLRS
jgi:hypothetical protein